MNAMNEKMPENKKLETAKNRTTTSRVLVTIFALVLSLTFILAAQAFAQVSPEGPEGIVSYWKFEEGSGSTAYDSVNGNHGTLYNGPQWTFGKFGGALGFDGVDDYVRVPHNDSLNSQELTLEAWIYLNEIETNNYIIHKGSGGVSGAIPGYSGYDLYVAPGGKVVARSFDVEGYRRDLGTDYIIQANQWHYIVVTNDGAVLKIYVDGELASFMVVNGVSSFPNLDNLWVGTYPHISGWGPFNGIIDEVRISNTARTAEEIKLDYHLAAFPSDPDSDGDGIPDEIDNSPNVSNPGQEDSDRDEVGDVSDVCPYEYGSDANGCPVPGTLSPDADTVALFHLDHLNEYVVFNLAAQSYGIKYGSLWTLGKFGEALGFDGVDDYVIVSHKDSLNPQELTLEAWIYLNEIETYNYIIHKGSGGVSGGTPGHSGYDLYVIRDMVYARSFDVEGYRKDLSTDHIIQANQWHYIAVTNDASTLKIYVDGELANFRDVNGVSSFPNLDNLWVGTYPHMPTWAPFNGIIDEIRISNIARTAEEIQANFGLHIPVANAGDNLSISSEDQGITVLQGTATDPDNDFLTFRWLEGTTELSTGSVGASGEASLDLNTVQNFSIGEHTLTLEVSDGKATSTDDMILTVDNSAPHAAPTGGGVYEFGNPVTLAGQVSDFDGDVLTYEWLEGTDSLASGLQSTIVGGDPVDLPSHDITNLNIGSHKVTLRVNDGVNDPIIRDILLEMVDTTVPTLAPEPNKTILWPPNHKMVDIMIEANAVDNSGGLVTLSAAVSSNEPEDGLEDEDVAPDWSEPVIDQANGIIDLQLRSERSGSGSGRVYTITITATDGSNNSSQSSVKIIVPHDKSKK